ncbi:helix-turn-helix domain-containing protein [uncultured Sphingomonas sp.]|uniref:AraC family transcriptional regulator n=1 Tax=uncultured Sphingomonas sp. TaxID=158754 RepID=UPI0025DCA1B9|nr:helix-turn-helix domain-containing protein [uncultured Sphingomonas sp.]
MSEAEDGLDVRSLAATFRPGTILAEHRHGWGQLVFATRGILHVRTEAALWVVPPTRAIWIPAGVAHALTMQGEVAMRTLYIAAPRSAPLPDAPTVLTVLPLLRELILHLLALGMLHRDRAEEDRLAAVLIDLLRTAPHEDRMLPLPRDARARRVALHCQQAPADRRSLTALAREAGGSIRTLQRAFPRETGLTLEAWRQKARLLHAAGLLGDGASVTSTALDSGYDSVAAFSTAFRRQFGTSPARYRRGEG